MSGAEFEMNLPGCYCEGTYDRCSVCDPSIPRPEPKTFREWLRSLFVKDRCNG